MQKQSFHVAGVEGFIEGEGQHTIVMIHGWPDTHRIWDAQVEFFKQHYRCVTFTLPGFDPESATKPRQGFSLVHVIDVIKAVVDHVSPNQAVYLLLHDWGCFFGYQYAMHYANRVLGVIGTDVGDAGSLAFLKSLSIKQIGMILTYQLTLAAAWRIGGSKGDKISRNTAKLLKAPTDSKLIHANLAYPYYIQWAQAFGSYRKAKPVKLNCPTLYMYGKNKPVMFQSDQWLGKISQKPHNQVIAFDSAHWIMVEKAPEYNQAVFNWLTSIG